MNEMHGKRREPRAFWPALVLTVLAGGLLPLQFAVNGALADHLGSVTLTGTLSYAAGTLGLLVLLGLSRQRPDWTAARQAPRWSWLGGVVGSAYVVGSVVLTQALGTAVATTLVIAAQVVTAIGLDHLGGLGLERRRVNPARAGALALVLAALGLRLWGAA
ncbi:DMT family transporter [Deinococcus sp. MIMF12]|uniref:DMT family transporter n=1 Tax=Deinococcus rhizophilus TaxID=3049544 RepID=A0ABT7JG40_9DEIO|nr:DMT family transporter [Deinococcus rhizophilus]MDL2342908.1 DMT family transporter [Deinococcus rhizophilus]